MDNIGLNQDMTRKLAPKEEPKKTDFDMLVESASFVLAMGLMVMGAGMICFIAFRNLFSMYLLDIGMIVALYSFAVKIVDVFLRLIGKRQ